MTLTTSGVNHHFVTYTNDEGKKGRALTMTLPLCEAMNPLRVFTSP